MIEMDCPACGAGIIDLVIRCFECGHWSVNKDLTDVQIGSEK